MIKISIEEVKQVCNLTDLKKTELLTSKFELINARLSEITDTQVYELVLNETAEPLVITSFKHAFAYFIYAEVIDLLNTNTTGSGIIRSTGFADSRTELLSYYETSMRQQKLELKAYTLLLKYLNERGMKRYNELKLWDDLHRAENDQAKQNIINKGKSCTIAII